MANGLEVNADGLRVAAAASDAVATSLTSAALVGITSTRPSTAGVSAVDAVLTSVRGRQSRRIIGQAADLSTAANGYDGTDDNSAENITVTV
jgi:hypothetical protein